MADLFDPRRVCAVVLAGGQGSRMGGADKGLQIFRGKPLVTHALERLQTQHGGAPACIAISANRNLATYTQWCSQVWPDTLTGYAGPLAGFLTALEHCASAFPEVDYVLTVPCDSPLFPLDLLQRLGLALQTHHADLAMAQEPASDGDDALALRNQSVFCLMRTAVLPSLRAFMRGDERKIGAWALNQRHVKVPFNLPTDSLHAFANANTVEQLQRLEHP
jgi:molybdopterin-guanine dinucleotide biosynthesis protein A